MRALLNQHSYVVAAAVVWLAIAFVALRTRGGQPLQWRLTLLAGSAALALGGWFLARPGAGDVASAAALDAALASARQAGRPVLVEVYSEY